MKMNLSLISSFSSYIVNLNYQHLLLSHALVMHLTLYLFPPLLGLKESLMKVQEITKKSRKEKGI